MVIKIELNKDQKIYTSIFKTDVEIYMVRGSRVHMCNFLGNVTLKGKGYLKPHSTAEASDLPIFSRNIIHGDLKIDYSFYGKIVDNAILGETYLGEYPIDSIAIIQHHLKDICYTVKKADENYRVVKNTRIIRRDGSMVWIEEAVYECEDASEAIQWVIDNVGSVELEKGVYEVKKPIDMSNASIRGKGDD